MTTIEKRRRYQGFFLSDEAGQEFMTQLQAIIADNHTKAENEPALAREYSQRAKGVREVISHIQSLTTERSNPKQAKS